MQRPPSLRFDIRYNNCEAFEFSPDTYGRALKDLQQEPALIKLVKPGSGFDPAEFLLVPRPEGLECKTNRYGNIIRVFHKGDEPDTGEEEENLDDKPDTANTAADGSEQGDHQHLKAVEKSAEELDGDQQEIDDEDPPTCDGLREDPPDDWDEGQREPYDGEEDYVPEDANQESPDGWDLDSESENDDDEVVDDDEQAADDPGDTDSVGVDDEES